MRGSLSIYVIGGMVGTIYFGFVATQGGIVLLKHSHDLERFKITFKADLISIDLNQPYLYPTHNLMNTLVKNVGHGDVCDMIVNGHLIMKDKQILTLDQEKLLKQVNNIK